MATKIKASLTRSGIYIPYSEFQKAYGEEDMLVIKSIMSKFSLKHKTFKTHFITLDGFKTTRILGNKYLRLPRFGFFDLFRNPVKINQSKMSLNNFVIDNQIIIPKQINQLKWTGKLNANQPLCFDEIMRNFQKKIPKKEPLELS